MQNTYSTIVIADIRPCVDCGRYPAKRRAGKRVTVTARIFRHGTDILSAELLYRSAEMREWRTVEMSEATDDVWSASFVPASPSTYRYTVRAWVDTYSTWARNTLKWHKGGENIQQDVLEGIGMLRDIAARAGKDRRAVNSIIQRMNSSTPADALQIATADETVMLARKYQFRRELTVLRPELEMIVDRERASYSSWYEMFPRSQSAVPGRHGTFMDCERRLDDIREMGFDVLYLPPIHPIGMTNRRGKNGSAECSMSDPGSPWAIGNSNGGHKSIDPSLGTMEDFRHLLQTAGSKGIEIALDIALQCSPDHPYVREHPEWFKKRPDGSIRYAENPPKKYYDIFPLDFDTADRENLWEELRSIFLYWIDAGVKIFRVDNPHTKPFTFWRWLIESIRKEHPDVIFLAEAFTKPDVMYELSKIGFNMSYTYFTWKNFNYEIEQYFTELSSRYVSEFFRPMLFTNTPDILPFVLQNGGRAAFMMRALLAASLSPLWGIYSGFELCENSAIEGREEYLNSEKYEIKYRDWNMPGNIKAFIASLNRIRRENSAMQETGNTFFHHVDNPNLVCYSRSSEDGENRIIVVVNVNPFERQSAHVTIDADIIGLKGGESINVTDLLTGEKYSWRVGANYVELTPEIRPGHILRVDEVKQ